MLTDHYSKDVLEFFRKIYLLTMQGNLDWELTANPEILSAPIGQDYYVRIAIVEDFEGSSPEPDHVLYLLKGKDQLMQVTRMGMEDADVQELIAPHLPHVYLLFDSLWKRALSKATKLDQHIVEVVKLLDSKLERKPDA